MYARVTTLEVDTVRVGVEEALTRYREQFVPRLQEQEGGKGDRDPAGGRVRGQPAGGREPSVERLAWRRSARRGGWRAGRAPPGA